MDGILIVGVAVVLLVLGSFCWLVVSRIEDAALDRPFYWLLRSKQERERDRAIREAKKARKLAAQEHEELRQHDPEAHAAIDRQREIERQTRVRRPLPRPVSVCSVGEADPAGLLPTVLHGGRLEFAVEPGDGETCIEMRLVGLLFIDPDRPQERSFSKLRGRVVVTAGRTVFIAKDPAGLLDAFVDDGVAGLMVEAVGTWNENRDDVVAGHIRHCNLLAVTAHTTLSNGRGVVRLQTSALEDGRLRTVEVGLVCDDRGAVGDMARRIAIAAAQIQKEEVWLSERHRAELENLAAGLGVPEGGPHPGQETYYLEGFIPYAHHERRITRHVVTPRIGGDGPDAIDDRWMGAALVGRLAEADGDLAPSVNGIFGGQQTFTHVNLEEGERLIEEMASHVAFRSVPNVALAQSGLEEVGWEQPKDHHDARLVVTDRRLLILVPPHPVSFRGTWPDGAGIRSSAGHVRWEWLHRVEVDRVRRRVEVSVIDVAAPEKYSTATWILTLPIGTDAGDVFHTVCTSAATWWASDSLRSVEARGDSWSEQELVAARSVAADSRRTVGQGDALAWAPARHLVPS